MSTKITIRMPDFFKWTWLIPDPVLNPHNDEVSKDAEKYFIEYMELDEKLIRKTKAIDVGLFLSIWMPEAPKDRLQDSIDWGNWFWLYDDEFDAGDFQINPTLAKELMQKLFVDDMTAAAADDSRPKILKFHDEFFAKIVRAGNKDVTERYRTTMEAYQQGVIRGIEQKLSGVVPTVQDYLAYRRLMISVMPCVHVHEYVLSLDTPACVVNDPVIQELGIIASDFCILQNDMLSYQKEEQEGCLHNVVVIGRLHGLSAQQAFDQGDELLEGCYRRWDDAMSRVPTWDAETDAAAHEYIEAMKYIVIANLNYVYRAQRYYSKEACEDLRVTRKLEVLSDEDFWELNGKPMVQMREAQKDKETQERAHPSLPNVYGRMTAKDTGIPDTLSSSET